MDNKEIIQAALDYGIPSEKESITLEEVISFMKSNNVNGFLISEVKEGGLGEDLFKESNTNKGMVSVKNFVVWLHI
jgi:hypothetical protein